MNITVDMVKVLRERTGAGILECKKALGEANADIEAAIEIIRKMHEVSQAKVASRSTNAEGTIVVLAHSDNQTALLVEVNCETDFVARGTQFRAFAQSVAEVALAEAPETIQQLQQAVEAQRLELISATRENIIVRRMARLQNSEGMIGAYGHGDAHGVRIGALVALKNGNPELARDLAMQVAAMRPEYLNSLDIPGTRLEKEKEILLAQMQEEMKEADEAEPAADVAFPEEIVADKLRKWVSTITLLEQAFVKDPSKTVKAWVGAANAEVLAFERLEVGEGLEKKQVNFAEEVMAQVKTGE